MIRRRKVLDIPEFYVGKKPDEEVSRYLDAVLNFLPQDLSVLF